MDHWKKNPELGIRFSIERAVTDEMSAVSLGSGKLPVLGTPALVSALEESSYRCIEAFLNTGYDTVGIHVCIDHLKASAMGEQISCTAELVRIEGRSLTFKVFAEDGHGLICHGIHKRFVVNAENFMRKM